MRKRIEFLIDDFELGVNAISLVNEPAIEEYFLNFDNVKTNLTLSKIDFEKRIITGPALIPNKDIYRYDPTTNQEYYGWFSEETVLAITQKYFKEHRQDSITLDHKQFVNDVYIFESWLVRNPENDAANELGWSVNKNTLMVSMKVDDDSIWKKIKSNEIKGFSIEGMFMGQFASMKRKIKAEEEQNIEDILKDIILSEISDDEKYDKIEEAVKKMK